MKLFDKCFIVILFLLTTSIKAQYCEKYWAFGDSAGLIFQDGYTDYFVSGVSAYEASASISDSTGNLLFYTNGENVWNKNHEIMPNGAGLEIGLVDDDYGSSITQGVIIVPFPNSSELYYIFQLQDYNDPGIKYSVVDMSLDGSFGDITEKNIKIYNKDVTEKLQVIKHGNGRDWWVISHAEPDLAITDDSTFIFIKFLITPTGLEGPFEQVYGPLDKIPYNGWGEMCFNEMGSKLIYTRSNMLDIYDFDRCDGTFYNYTEVMVQESTSIYGAAFSSDGSKIYVTSVCGGGNFLYQYCLSCDGEPIDSTKEIIFENLFGGYCIGQIELGPDNKIYLALCKSNLPNNTFSEINKNLCVINFPNEWSSLCDFDTNTVSPGERRTLGNLPNMPNYNLGPLAGSECDTLGTAINNIIEETKITVYPNPVTENLTLHSSNNSELRYKIQTIHGQEIISGKFVNKENIYFNNYPAGIYVIEIKDATNKLLHIEKIIR